MLAAYLRGLLKSSIDYGVRSIMFDDVIIEAMAAQISVENFRVSTHVDSALASILTDEGKRSVIRRTQRQMQRQAALQLMDIYAVNSRRSKKEPGKLSLLQLFYLMKREGILNPDNAAAK